MVRKQSKENLPPKQRFMNGFRIISGSRNYYEVWHDLMELYSLSILNTCTKQMFAGSKRLESLWNARESRYLQTINKYSKQNQKIISQMFAMLVLGLERNPDQDLLGSIYMELGIFSSNAGQFFTPYSICKLMSGISFDKKQIAKQVHEVGFVSVNDSACGAGATLIAAAMECASMFKRLNYQNHIYFVANDVDRLCCMMCYIQLSLLGVAGIVTCNNTLTHPDVDFWKEPNNVYFTPIYLSDVWALRRFFHGYDIMFHKAVNVLQSNKDAEDA